MKKKELIYIGIAATTICLIGITAYYIINNAGFFDKSNNFTNSMGGTVLIPVLKYIWNKLIQLFYLIVTIIIGLLIICVLAITLI